MPHSIVELSVAQIRRHLNEPDEEKELQEVCVYYCSTYYKAVREGGGGKWRTCATRDNEPRPVRTSLPIAH